MYRERERSVVPYSRTLFAPSFTPILADIDTTDIDTTHYRVRFMKSVNARTERPCVPASSDPDRLYPLPICITDDPTSPYNERSFLNTYHRIAFDDSHARALRFVEIV